MMKRTLTILIIMIMWASVSQQAIAGNFTQQVDVKPYEDMKDEFKDAIANYRDARDTYNQERRGLKAVNRQDSSRLLEKAKTYMIHVNKVALQHFESLVSRIQSVKDIPEEKRIALIAEVGSDMQLLTATQADIKNAKSMDELRAIAKTMRENWRTYRGASKRTSGQVLTTKIAIIVEHGESISAKITKLAERFKSQGKDITRLEQLLAEFNGKLLLAKEKNDTASTQFGSIRNLEDVRLTFKEGMKLVKEAHKEIKEAHGILIDIRSELKALSGGN